MHSITILALCASLFHLSSCFGGAHPAAKPHIQTQPYYVWPKNATDQDANNEILKSLQASTSGDNAISVSQIGSDQSFVNFWLASLSQEDAKSLNESSLIWTVSAKCTDNCRQIINDFPSGSSQSPNEPPLLLKRDEGFTTQTGAQPEMVFISQPRILGSGGVPLDNLNGRYVFDGSAGRGATVYMIDTGAEDSNAEFVDIRPGFRWMGPNYFRGPGGSYMNAGEVGDSANDPHGTSVLSKIAGKQFGASKNINAVIVRHADQWTLADAVECVTWIINDWISIRNTDSQAVKVAIINMSFHDKVGQHFKATTQVDLVALAQFRDLLNRAITEGILPICAAGNEGTPVDGYPAMYAGLNNWDPSNNNGLDWAAPPVPGLLVVGATDNDGRIWTGSNTADFVGAYAPGVQVQVARMGGDPAPADGTSASCGTLSGLAAYWAALPSFNSRWGPATPWSQRVTDLKNQLVSMSYSRLPSNIDYPAAVWNGVTTADNHD